jgi:ATP-dependent Lon protease
MNPILYFDELDKISSSTHGEEVANFLVHLTDFSQNQKFQDYYFTDIDLDLSKCIFIFSYNNEELVNPILRDRMITIKAKGYTTKDKISLAQEYMLPKVFKEFGFSKTDLIFTDEIIEYIVNKVDEEEGARNMKRGFDEIIGSINFKKILGEQNTFPLTITQKIVDEWITTIGVRYFNELTNTAMLMEEVGEVARIMARRYGEQSEKESDKNKDLGDEMADVLFVLICLANQTGIDLTEALRKNLEKKTKRDLLRHKNNEKLNPTA